MGSSDYSLESNEKFVLGLIIICPSQLVKYMVRLMSREQRTVKAGHESKRLLNEG